MPVVVHPPLMHELRPKLFLSTKRSEQSAEMELLPRFHKTARRLNYCCYLDAISNRSAYDLAPIFGSQEMDPDQIEQMRQLAAGGAGAAPNERPDDPEVGDAAEALRNGSE
eukprot:6203093-Pleurochrysis_carterae.AAC.1